MPNTSPHTIAITPAPNPEGTQGRSRRQQNDRAGRGRPCLVRTGAHRSGRGWRLDPVSFDAPRDRHDLGDVALPVRATLDVTHEIDGRGQGRGDESRRHVLPRQERQDRQLVEGLAGRVRVHGRHARHTRVEGHQQVEGFGASDLADDQVLGAHTQRFTHEVTQRDLRPSPPRRPGASASRRGPS